MYPLELSLRRPLPEDARALEEIARRSGVLDVNSRYAYLLICSHFASTSIVAEMSGRVVGFASGYRLPDQYDTFFVWQVAVAAFARGRGIARRMVESVLRRQSPWPRYLEATVSPDNGASRRLFEGVAQMFSAACEELPGYDATLFLPGVHESEPLLRIGPLKSRREFMVQQREEIHESI